MSQPAELPVAPEVRATWGMGDAVLGTVGGTFAALVVAGIAYAVAGVSSEEIDEIPLWAVGLLQLPLWLVLVGVVVRASRTKGTGSLRRDFGLVMEWRDVPLGLLVGLVSQFALALVLLPLYEVLGIDQDDVGKTAEELADRADDVFGVIVLAIVVVLIAPVVEELFYRGLWLRSAERRWGIAWAVVTSSLVFGLIHLQPIDTFALVGVGIVTGVLTARTGRLGPAIWAHIAFNATAVVTLLA